ncbi:tetratricopeptide repeat protein [Flammeovirga kamogawensis]|nr:tetratricopeptide repeat protein [Flammeovirga kamogawensis]
MLNQVPTKSTYFVMTKYNQLLLSSIILFLSINFNCGAQNFTTYFADGKAAYDQQNFNKAIQFFQKARLQGKETIGDTHPDYILDIEYLAKSYQGLKDLGNANIYYMSLEKLLQKSGNTVSKKMGDTQEVIASNSVIMKNYAQADVYFQKTLNTREKTEGKDSKEYTLSLHKYSQLYLKGRKYKEAEGMYRQLEPLAEKNLKGTADQAKILAEQAEVYLGLKRVDEASIQLSISISAYEKTTAPKSSYVHLYLQEASLLEKAGKRQEAITAYYKYVEVLESAFGIKNKKYTAEVERLAIHFDEKLHSPMDSYNMINKKLAANIATYSDNSLQAAVTYIELAEMEIEQNKIPLAEEHTVKAMEIYAELGKANSPDGIAASITLARVHSILKKNTEAEAMYKKAIADTEKYLSTEHTTYGKSLDSLAFFFIEHKRFEEAEKTIEKGLTARQKSVGKQHIDYGNSLYSLSKLYTAQDSLEKAEKTLINVAKVREAYYGALTVEHATCIKELGDLYKGMGEEQQVKALKTYRRAIHLFEGIGYKESAIVKEIYNSIDEINAR